MTAPHPPARTDRRSRPACRVPKRYTPLTTAPAGSSADAPGPLLRDPPLEPDAGAQADEGVEVVEAVAEPITVSRCSTMSRVVTGWGDTRQRRPSNGTGQRIIAENMEVPS